MAICQDEKRYYDTLFGRENSWVVRCDKCGLSTLGGGMDPGDASEIARKEGFKTVPCGSLPSEWRCPEHLKK